ncbi:MAG: hypothetical protein H7174_03710 [Flavobacterium sp.]|nr:hypothetical protein [Flavobacterium sp.]
MKNCKNLLTGFLTVLTLMTLNSCTKDSATPNANAPTTPTGQDVYIAGYEFNTSTQKNNATYWKNGIAIPLPVADESLNTKAFGICVVGPDVYVCGHAIGLTTEFALYWKNGVPVYLTDGMPSHTTTGIVVVGSDVYVSGIATNPSGTYVPTYWKNGIATYLPTNYSGPGLLGLSTGIAVSGNAIYVSGFEALNSSGTNYAINAKYWRNGVVTNLTNYTINNRVYAHDIAIAGNDVFVAGSLDYRAVYWRNGVVTTLSGTSSNSAAISLVGSDVYVFGDEQTAGTSNAVYWKNGISTNLSNGSSFDGIVDGAVVGSDVFAIGGSSVSWGGVSTAKYWKNTTETIIGGSGTVLTSIFVSTN